MTRGSVLYGTEVAGYIQETDEGYEFYYDPGYLAGGGAQPVSLTLPLRGEPYKSKILFPFFDGLIPEGWLLNMAIRHWKIKPNDRFQLLLATCSDAIGAVSIVADEEVNNN